MNKLSSDISNKLRVKRILKLLQLLTENEENNWTNGCSLKQMDGENFKNSPVKGWSGLSRNVQTYFWPFEITAEMKTKVQNSGEHIFTPFC